jgi:hypothetical protein
MGAIPSYSTHYLSNGTVEVPLRIRQSDAYIGTAIASDIADEQDLIGTERTMVTRLGFGSEEIEYDVLVYGQADFAKLETIRKSQAISGTSITFEGENYDMQYTSGVRVTNAFEPSQRIYQVRMRLKRV